MSDLSDLIPSLERMVAPPGQFAALYPDAGSNDMLGLLMDGLAEATLDGFFFSNPVVWTDDGITTPDVTRGEQALIVIYAGTRFITAELKQSNTRTHYKAGTVEYEVESGASVISEILKELQARKNQLILQQSQLGVSAAFLMADSYLINAIGGAWCDGLGYGIHPPYVLG